MAKLYFKRLCVPLLCSGWESSFVLLMVCLKHLRHGSLLLCLSAVADDTHTQKKESLLEKDGVVFNPSRFPPFSSEPSGSCPSLLGPTVI